MQQSDHDSDEDLGSSADEEEQMLRYIDQFGLDPSHFRFMSADGSIRTAQLLRGQMSTKRVASKKAIDQLQSVDPDSLPENERSKLLCLSPSGRIFSLMANLPGSMRHLLQRLWPSEPRRRDRGTAASAQVPARVWRPLHQEMVARVGQLPILPRQAPFRVCSHLRPPRIPEPHPHAPPNAAKRGPIVRDTLAFSCEFKLFFC
jgi:hypothetical protein